MKENSLKVAVVSAFVIIFSVTAPLVRANIVYTSPDWINVNSSPTGSPLCTSCYGIAEVSDVFTLTSATMISGVDVGVLDWYGSPHASIEVNVWDISLTTNLFSQTLNSFSSVFTGNGVEILSLGLTGLNLGAGSYRMSWFDPNAMAIASYIGNSTTLMQSHTRVSGAYVHTNLNEGAAFQIYGLVPEPETYAMLLAGLGLLGFMARRRKESAV